MRIAPLLAPVALLALASGCGNEKVDYEDPNAATLVDEYFNDTDLKQMSDKLTQSMLRSNVFAENPAKKPVVIVKTVTNRTDEHIDIKSLTDKIRTGIAKSGRVDLVDETALGDLRDEYEHNASGEVDPATAKGPGHQIAADYTLRGDFAGEVHENKSQKTRVIFYKLTLQLTDTAKRTIVWTDDAEVKKVRRK